MADTHARAAAALGLTDEAITAQRVRARRDELLGYLDRAPAPLADDAHRRAETIRHAAETLLAELASEAEAANSCAGDEAPSPVAAWVATAGSPEWALSELGEDDEDTPAPAVVTPSVTQRERARDDRETARPQRASNGALTLGVLIGLVACAVVVLSVYALGRPSSSTPPAGHPDTAASAAATTRAPSEVASQIAGLRAAVKAKPGDLATRLRLGVTLFEAGDLAGAKEQWDAVVAADPSNEEAYFNLGFWYLSQEPPQTAQAERMWDRVLELAPNSEHAHIIAMHRGEDGPLPTSGASPTSDTP